MNTSEHIAFTQQCPLLAPLAFDGETFDPVRDGKRLTTQLMRVYGLMKDGKWRTLAEIARQAGGAEASVSARLRDLRKQRFGAMTVERRRRAGGLWEYSVLESRKERACSER